MLEDHELKIVRGGLAGFIKRPSSPNIPTNPSFSFAPTARQKRPRPDQGHISHQQEFIKARSP